MTTKEKNLEEGKQLFIDKEYEICDIKETFKKLEGKYLKIRKPEKSEDTIKNCVNYIRLENVVYVETENIIQIHNKNKKEIVISGLGFDERDITQTNENSIKHVCQFLYVECPIDINELTKYLITEITKDEFIAKAKECKELGHEKEPIWYKVIFDGGMIK